MPKKLVILFLRARILKMKSRKKKTKQQFSKVMIYIVLESQLICKQIKLPIRPIHWDKRKSSKSKSFLTSISTGWFIGIICHENVFCEQFLSLIDSIFFVWILLCYYEQLNQFQQNDNGMLEVLCSRCRSRVSQCCYFSITAKTHPRLLFVLW